MVEYSPGYLADHWCDRGHVLYVLEGELGHKDSIGNGSVIRPGDVQHSQADIAKATALLGYRPSHRVAEGLAQAMRWYTSTLGRDGALAPIA